MGATLCVILISTPFNFEKVHGNFVSECCIVMLFTDISIYFLAINLSVFYYNLNKMKLNEAYCATLGQRSPNC